MEEDKSQEIKNLKADLERAGFRIKVVNTFTGQCWDRAESKGFALIYAIDNNPIQLNPYYLKNLGFDSHFKEKYAKCHLFFSGVLGMSRSFEIVYNLSQWLFGDGYKLKVV